MAAHAFHVHNEAAAAARAKLRSCGLTSDRAADTWLSHGLLHLLQQDKHLAGSYTATHLLPLRPVRPPAGEKAASYRTKLRLTER
jgi:hypothetical protein